MHDVNKKKLYGFKLIVIILTVICFFCIITDNAVFAGDRASTIIKYLKSYDADIVKKNPAAIIEKYNKIAESPFSFYRGTAVLFYHDMADASSGFNENDRNYLKFGLSETYINGDMHIANFGFVRNSDNNAQFDANDFDETFIAPYLWDLKRAAASLCLHSRANEFKENEAVVVEKFLSSFIESLKSGKIKDYSLTAKNADGFLKDNLKKLDDNKRKDFLEKLTAMSEPNKFLKNEELIEISGEKYDKIKEVFQNQYVVKVVKRFSENGKKINADYFNVLNICEKLHSGTGSLGLNRYYILVSGDSKNCDRNIVIEMKQQRNSVVSNFVPNSQKVANSFKGDGRRVIFGTYAMASNISPFIDYCDFDGVQYTFREVSPQKSSVKLEKIGFNETLELAEAAGKIYAKIFVKSTIQGKTSNEKKLFSILSDESKINEFKKSLVEFGVKYAEIVESDYKVFISKKKNLIKEINDISKKQMFLK